MKISIVVHDLKGGGAEKMMVRLANGLAEGGDEVSLVLLTQGGVNKDFVSSRVRLVELCAPRTVMSFARLRRYLVAEKPDRILAALTHVNVIATVVCASCGMLGRLFVSERNAFSRDKKVNPDPLVRAAYAVAPWLYRLQPNPVIAVSEGVARDLVDTTVVRAQDVTWAPNPVLDNDFESVRFAAPSHPWLVSREYPVILAAGRLAPQKGFDILVRAFAHLVARRQCRLVIYGEGVERPRLEAQIQELGIAAHVSLPGYTTSVLTEMAHSDLFVLSSRFEGSPNVLVEAMGTGVPVVATDCPYGPHEILDGGSVAPLAPVEDAEALARALDEGLTVTGEGRALRLQRARLYTIANAAQAYRNILMGQPGLKKLAEA